jgi:hypothetical protein
VAVLLVHLADLVEVEVVSADLDLAADSVEAWVAVLVVVEHQEDGN